VLALTLTLATASGLIEGRYVSRVTSSEQNKKNSTLLLVVSTQARRERNGVGIPIGS
jgi:hypothetical protein